MATMYCSLCDRPVEAKRQIGAGTIILAVLTGGLWLLAIPFYQKRCCICRSAAVSHAVPGSRSSSSTMARLASVEQRLAITETELETATTELERLRTERDFYRDLVGNPDARGSVPRGGVG